MFFIPSCLDILSQYIDSTGKVTSFLRHPLELQYYLLRPKCLVYVCQKQVGIASHQSASFPKQVSLF